MHKIATVLVIIRALPVVLVVCGKQINDYPTQRGRA
jgi:hypothetical protein